MLEHLEKDLAKEVSRLETLNRLETEAIKTAYEKRLQALAVEIEKVKRQLAELTLGVFKDVQLSFIPRKRHKNYRKPRGIRFKPRRTRPRRLGSYRKSYSRNY